MLFDITVDPKLIAGVAIYYNSRYFDFSIKPIFDRILKEVVTGKPTTPAAPKPIAATQTPIAVAQSTVATAQNATAAS